MSSKSLKYRPREEPLEASLPPGVAEFNKTKAEVFERYMQSVNLTHYLKKTKQGRFTRFKLKQTFEPDLNEQVLRFMENFKSYSEEVKFKDYKECA